MEGISKSFGGVKALSGVSFAVEPGRLYGLIGPDGAGKTTLERILTTLMLPDSGKATVCGLDCVRDMRQIRRKIGYMPGKFALYQDLTVEENVRFFASLFGTTLEEGYGSIKDIYCQIEKFSSRRAGALSGGMKQKLALCCALIHSPEVLFLDEPTTGVDPVSRKELWQMLRSLNGKGITILVSTPYLDEIRMCQEVAFLDGGTVKATGTPEDILERFSETFTPKADFDGERDPSQGEDIIKVEHLVKAFGDFRAVDDISFSVHKGEIFGFLGANGAGKTTAMKILTGLSTPTSGKVSVAGFDASFQSEEIKRNIGYMSQKFSLYEDLSIAENMSLFGGIYGMGREEIRLKTDKTLCELDFTSHRDTPVKDIPTGWRQRLSFAVATMHSPAVVFLDEPTGGVDPGTRVQFWKLIRRASSEGTTVFVTTHYMDEAQMCDRICIMVDGKIRAMGEPDAIVREKGCRDMDGLFTLLARQSQRQA